MTSFCDGCCFIKPNTLSIKIISVYALLKRFLNKDSKYLSQVAINLMKEVLIDNWKVFAILVKELVITIYGLEEILLYLFVKIKIFDDLNKFNPLVLRRMINYNHYK